MLLWGMRKMGHQPSEVWLSKCVTSSLMCIHVVCCFPGCVVVGCAQVGAPAIPGLAEQVSGFCVVPAFFVKWLFLITGALSMLLWGVRTMRTWAWLSK